MPSKPFVLPSGVDLYVGDGSAAGSADPLFRVDDTNNRVGINNQTPTGTLDIIVASSGDKGLVIRSAGSQSGNLFELLDSSNSGLLTVDASGSVFFRPWSGTLTSSVRFNAPSRNLIFTGSGTSANSISLNVLDDSTLSFEGTAGQLFAVADGLSSGTIFSVNDISGMSSIEVDASGLIKLGEYDGYVGIGTSQTFSQYVGKVEIQAPSGYRTLVLRPGSGSTSNILELQSFSSGILGVVDASGRFNIGSTGTQAMLEVDAINSTTRGVIIQGAASQAANLLEVRNSSSTVLNIVDPSGKVAIISAAPTGTLDVTAVTASTKAVVIKGTTSQTANLLDLQNVSGTILTTFDSSGRMSQNIAGNTTNLAIGAGTLNTFNGTWNSVTVVGNGAGANMGSAGLNTAIGANAMAGTVGNNNTAIGLNAMASATSSFTNSVAIGDSSMQYASGGNNTAIGNNSLRYAGGQYNVGIGVGAGAAITTGGGNVIIGANAGLSITTSNYSVLIGQDAGQSATSTITAVGYGALKTATGASNTAFGNSAAGGVTVGSNNTVMGNATYLYAPSGSNNVVVGASVLPNAYNDISNSVVIGQNAMNAATTSTNQVVIGRQAGYAITTGGSNTLLGFNAGYTITTGAGNTLIGTSADVSTNSIAGSIAIGSGAQANQNNQLVIGSTSTKVGKSDGTGEQSVTSVSPTGISRLLEARINGTIYNIPLLPSGTTDLQNFTALNVASGITLPSGVPAVTTNKLYNNGTALYWNGSPLAATAGSNTQVIYNSGGSLTGSSSLTWDGTVLSANLLKSTQSVTNEGGQIDLALPLTGSTLSGTIAIDVYQNRLRFFETGGANRGAYIDLTSAGAGAGTNLLAGGGGGTTTNSLTFGSGLSNSTATTFNGATAVTVNMGGTGSLTALSVSSGITVTSGVPGSTTNVLYANASTLYWNGQVVSTGTTASSLTFGSGLSGSTATTFTGATAVTVNLGGTGSLTALTVTSGINISSGVPSSTASNLYTSGTTLYWNGQLVTTGITGSGTPSGIAFWSSATNLSYDTGILYSTTNKRFIFTGTGTAASPINMNILSNSTLSFESTAGQLFSIADGLQSGRIFAVTDISGMPFMEVDASGYVKLAEYDGFIGIGTSQPFANYVGKIELVYPSGAYKGIVVRPATGGTGNILEAQSSSSGTLIVFDASGEIGVNNPVPGAMVDVISRASTVRGLLIKAAASQAANLLEIQNSSSNVIFAVTPSGAISGAMSPTILQTTSGITLTDVHNGYIVEYTGTGATGTFTLGSVTIPSWNCMVVNISTGIVQMASGTGNTVRSPGGLLKSRTTNSSISIYRRGSSDFVLAGDLA